MHRYLIFAASLASAALTQSTYYGCYTDTPARALTGSFLFASNMTLALCEAHCKNYTLWGVEYSTECYCGNSLGPRSFPTFSTDCYKSCGGDKNETCGGDNRLSLYGKPAENPASTPHVYDPPVTATQYVGCYTELPVGRALSEARTYSMTLMTVGRCGAFCRDSGFRWFGLEFSSECFCGDEVHANSTLAQLDSECSMACTGNATETCGGSNRISVYKWV
ncbi:hypothetical protein VTJ83DRAFT_1355 [Remersonia thermophila]|uniref:WSC domain-containing protein n=1 Tax=Remersonia thermophila TaxID=72144 RepID=A0ABR4DPH1_9PEZI